MSIPRALFNTSVALALAPFAFFTASASAQLPPPPPDSTVVVAETPEAPKPDDRYRDGIVIWETPDGARVPFLLNFNINTQLRYLNTLSSDETYTDHLGVVRDVHRRNDITVNRAMFILGGYIFDKRLRYSRRVEHWLAIQPGPDRHRRVYRGARQSIAREHLPVFCGDRPEYG